MHSPHGRTQKCFDHEQALRLAGVMAEVGINSQACFVVGYPGEKMEMVADRVLSEAVRTSRSRGEVLPA